MRKVIISIGKVINSIGQIGYYSRLIKDTDKENSNFVAGLLFLFFLIFLAIIITAKAIS